MEQTRCAWATGQPNFYIKYHDKEWGVPVHDEHKHFEFLLLEGAQAGLNWATILKKRTGYRQAFHGFDPEKVAKMSDAELGEALKNPAIIRNRRKVFSARNNARIFLQIQKEFGSFDSYIWGFVEGRPIMNHWHRHEDVPVTTNVSDALSKDLKKRGMSFVGSTIIYAHMQAIGMVNDHLTTCFRHPDYKNLDI